MPISAFADATPEVESVSFREAALAPVLVVELKRARFLKLRGHGKITSAATIQRQQAVTIAPVI
jgi:hypothetical protein